VVAVERASGVLVEFEKGFRVEREDVVFVCGTLEGIDRYMREYHASPTPVVSPQ
jgi:tRNA G37 N-methylase TrmD